MLMKTPERGPVAGVSVLNAAESVWEGPLFLIGMPRSGTKLLRGLLSQHPNIAMLPAETQFMPFLDRWVRVEGQPATALRFERMYLAMRDAAYFNFRRAEHAFAWQGWRERCRGQYDVAALFQAFMRYELGIEPGTGVVWGDKSPAYVRCVPLLLKHFPQARIIHLVRDVRDHCASIRKAWRKDVRRAASRWGCDVHAAHVACSSRPQQCIELHYEDLLQHPRRELLRLCEFMDLKYLKTLDELSQSVENYGDATGEERIVRGNFNKFEQRMRPSEIEAVEALSWDTLLEMGYIPTRARGPRQLTPTMQHWLRLKDGVNLVLSDVPRHGLRKAVRLHTRQQHMTAH